MNIPTEKEAIERTVKLLANLIGVDQDTEQISLYSQDNLPCNSVKLGSKTVFLVWIHSKNASDLSRGIQKVLNAHQKYHGESIPLLSVPYMGATGAKRCHEAGISWIDLSGNAHITGRGLRIHIEGKPNQFKQPGRPSSPFAPKSSRIARWFLIHLGEAVTQRKLSKATGLGEGFTSKIVGRLVNEGLLVRDSGGAVYLNNPDALLDAWLNDYRFNKHTIYKGHIAARSGDILLKHLAREFNQVSISYAVTGLGAAWILNRFAGFRLVTFYISNMPAKNLLDRLDFREVSSGSNVWLVVPNDEGVFHGASDNEGVRCVHPVQIYLDLASQPERAAEAAKRLREDYISGKL